MATEDTKQIKVVGFYLTVVTLALLFAGYKGCEKGCADGCDPSNCRDEFIPESSNNSQCSPGAVAEVVTEPKRGIICHCTRMSRQPKTPNP
jgi:hypothetical protein